MEKVNLDIPRSMGCPMIDTPRHIVNAYRKDQLASYPPQAFPAAISTIDEVVRSIDYRMLTDAWNNRDHAAFGAVWELLFDP